MKRGVCILCMVMAWLQTVCAGEWHVGSSHILVCIVLIG